MFEKPYADFARLERTIKRIVNTFLTNHTDIAQGIKAGIFSFERQGAGMALVLPVGKRYDGYDAIACHELLDRAIAGLQTNRAYYVARYEGRDSITHYAGAVRLPTGAQAGLSGFPEHVNECCLLCALFECGYVDMEYITAILPFDSWQYTLFLRIVKASSMK